MTTNLHITDEVLMAYADGELDAAQAAHVERAMQLDTTLAARVAQHRALREQLQSGLSGVLAEPIPTRLLNTLQAQPARNDATDNVVDLARLRQQHTPSPARRWHTQQWAAMAASLIAGVVIGMYALNFNASGLIATGDGALLARGALADALTTQLASAATNEPGIDIGISFRNRDGEYCRSFAVQDGSSLAGVACHEQGNWHVQMLTEVNMQGGEFRQAGSATPPAVLALIEQQIAGEPLDADAEAAALRGGWR